MFFPVSEPLAELSASKNGYDITDSYTDTKYRYYYNGLSDTEKSAYRIIYASIKDFPDEIMVPKVNDKELEHVFAALSYDNPELFFISNHCMVRGMGSMYYFVPQYTMNKEKYEACMAEIESVAADIVLAASQFTDEFDKELYVHDWLASHNEYSDAGDGMTYSMYGALVNGKAGCEGYSRAAQYLLKALGVENYLATGDAPDEVGSMQGHMWNIVKINGEMYNLDITWDDYSITGSVDCPDNTPSHIYFNMSTKDLSITHSAEDKDLWKDCTAESYGYFRQKGLMFSTYDDGVRDSIKNQLVKVLESGASSIELAFTDATAYEEAFSKMTDTNNGQMYSMLTWANSRVPSGKVDASRMQYTEDKVRHIVRFFFTK